MQNANGLISNVLPFGTRHIVFFIDGRCVVIGDGFAAIIDFGARCPRRAAILKVLTQWKQLIIVHISAILAGERAVWAGRWR